MSCITINWVRVLGPGTGCLLFMRFTNVCQPSSLCLLKAEIAPNGNSFLKASCPLQFTMSQGHWVLGRLCRSKGQTLPAGALTTSLCAKYGSLLPWLGLWEHVGLKERDEEKDLQSFMATGCKHTHCCLSQAKWGNGGSSWYDMAAHTLSWARATDFIEIPMTLMWFP